MTVSVRAYSTSGVTQTPLTFVRYSVPHEGHTYYSDDPNEDTILLDRKRGLAAVFDGVGSGPGQVASRLAARVMRRTWKKLHTEPCIVPFSSFPRLEEMILHLFDAAHQQIILEGERRAQSMQEYTRYPATTAALTLFSYDEDAHIYYMSYAHVGDSRIYLWRPDHGLKRLTDDDGYLALKISDGSITPEDALRIDQASNISELSRLEKSYFDNRNGITQALGHEKSMDVHIGHIDVQPGDRVLLCSDGIHDNLTDKTLALLLEKEKRTTAARKIVQQAIASSHQNVAENMRAKSDDMSAVVITCTTIS
ncbi:PP2C family protein-serine/threonine phosphatase [Dictyobacter aurantiacus]|uniref:Protein-serine/threonine phosphatase n=1 Tax=Dictyobacter aurantiacus TaxID=1936993 RepID=A0A401ZS58_9CHLR|nr:PP2C family serine/threonine-protein phosphatase [Dictyobacter aurantiacus]GCE09610.1 protein-serine/threonine phosphatase [Dictyobacter aurantiacus]